jgi:hypothetical protein
LDGPGRVADGGDACTLLVPFMAGAGFVRARLPLGGAVEIRWLHQAARGNLLPSGAWLHQVHAGLHQAVWFGLLPGGWTSTSCAARLIHLASLSRWRSADLLGGGPIRWP